MHASGDEMKLQSPNYFQWFRFGAFYCRLADRSQLFIVGFHGHVASADIKTLITTHKVGAVILFLRNISIATQLIKLTSSLQAIAASAGHEQDLFIAIDQENGLVTRIKPPVAAQLPGSMALGATGDVANAFTVASATAEMLRAFGINMNYAPIADVNSEPKNPVIGVRSPSDDPETVGRFVSAQVKGLSNGGILPCVKHFPGHGDTAVDSHFGLPVISKNRAELDLCELVPFRRAVVEGVESVMTAHIAMPGIGEQSLGEDHPSKKLPASLNPEAIKILREEMKFDGMIVSDCLEMDGSWYREGCCYGFEGEKLDPNLGNCS
jgi:beta-N-acetylhexosaminidase